MADDEAQPSPAAAALLCESCDRQMTAPGFGLSVPLRCTCFCSAQYDHRPAVPQPHAPTSSCSLPHSASRKRTRPDTECESSPGPSSSGQQNVPFHRRAARHNPPDSKARSLNAGESVVTPTQVVDLTRADDELAPSACPQHGPFPTGRSVERKQSPFVVVTDADAPNEESGNDDSTSPRPASTSSSTSAHSARSLNWSRYPAINSQLSAHAMVRYDLPAQHHCEPIASPSMSPRTPAAPGPHCCTIHRNRTPTPGHSGVCVAPVPVVGPPPRCPANEQRCSCGGSLGRSPRDPGPSSRLGIEAATGLVVQPPQLYAGLVPSAAVPLAQLSPTGTINTHQCQSCLASFFLQQHQCSCHATGGHSLAAGVAVPSRLAPMCACQLTQSIDHLPHCPESASQLVNRNSSRLCHSCMLQRNHTYHHVSPAVPTSSILPPRASVSPDGRLGASTSHHIPREQFAQQSDGNPNAAPQGFPTGCLHCPPCNAPSCVHAVHRTLPTSRAHDPASRAAVLEALLRAGARQDPAGALLSAGPAIAVVTTAAGITAFPWGTPWIPQPSIHTAPQPSSQPQQPAVEIEPEVHQQVGNFRMASSRRNPTVPMAYTAPPLSATHQAVLERQRDQLDRNREAQARWLSSQRRQAPPVAPTYAAPPAYPILQATPSFSYPTPSGYRAAASASAGVGMPRAYLQPSNLATAAIWGEPYVAAVSGNHLDDHRDRLIDPAAMALLAASAAAAAVRPSSVVTGGFSSELATAAAGLVPGQMATGAAYAAHAGPPPGQPAVPMHLLYHPSAPSPAAFPIGAAAAHQRQTATVGGHDLFPYEMQMYSVFVPTAAAASASAAAAAAAAAVDHLQPADAAVVMRGIDIYAQLSAHRAQAIRDINDLPRGASDELIQRCTTKSIFRKKMDEEVDHCTICLSEFQEAEELRLLSCTHSYHVGCIDRWLTSNKRCPICRLEIDRIATIAGPSGQTAPVL